MTVIGLRGSAPAERRLIAGVLAAAVAAWAVTANRMAGMDAGPGAELGGVGWFGVSWLVMMAAMMLPAAAPMVVAYGGRRPGLPRSCSTCERVTVSATSGTPS